MAQVLPAERELRRVIGDGDTIPDREVDGLSERDLLELHGFDHPRAGSTVVEVAGSHAIYVSQPQAVADLIKQAASELSQSAR